MLLFKFKMCIIIGLAALFVSSGKTVAQNNTVVLSSASDKEVINSVSLDRIVLNVSELENLGITYKDKKLNVVIESNYKISKKTSDEYMEILTRKGYKPKTGICRTGVSVDPVSILPDEEPLKYEGWSHTKGTFRFPVAITIEFANVSNQQDKSNLSTMYVAGNSPALKELTQDMSFKWEKDKFVPKVDKLLPVTFIVESKDENKPTVKFHFWYYATKEMIDKLPERYKKEVFEEFGFVEDINNGKITPDEACEKIIHDNFYFDICENRSGALGGMTVFPNPVSTHAKCRLVLSDSRNISAFLYDGGGARISNIMANSGMNAGNNDFDIPFDELPSGIYILVVTTDKNERISAKIIVNK